MTSFPHIRTCKKSRNRASAQFPSAEQRSVPAGCLRRTPGAGSGSGSSCKASSTKADRRGERRSMSLQQWCSRVFVKCMLVGACSSMSALIRSLRVVA